MVAWGGGLGEGAQHPSPKRQGILLIIPPKWQGAQEQRSLRRHIKLSDNKDILIIITSNNTNRVTLCKTKRLANPGPGINQTRKASA